MTFANNTASPISAPAIRIGRFRIIRELGRGAIGRVYLAHDPVIDRSVAIKTFSSTLSPSQKRKHEQQFINEARAAGRLTHPNIVTIFDASSEGGTTYIAMEYLAGQELSKILDSGKRFTPDEVATVIWKIADALNYAHQHQVIHRDIKPANIFMVGDNQPKIVDFGIARCPNRVAEEEAEQAYTLFCNNLLGTPNYMSPEQALGRAADHRTDIYSLGSIMYEMLAGCKPFKARNTAHMLQQIAQKIPPAPHALDPRLPLVLSHIAMKAMSKRPDSRYLHAEEMALDIKRYMVKEKRSRQRIQNEMPMLEQPDADASKAAPEAVPSPAQAGRRRLFWTSGIAAAGVLAYSGLKLIQ